MVIAQIFLLPALVCARVRSFGPRGHLIDPKLHAGKVNAVAQQETLAWEHTLDESVEAGIVTYFWIESGGSSPFVRYVGDNLIIRYYIDGEPSASIAFTPSMAAGTGVGLEGAAYYAANQSDPTGSSNCSAAHHGISLCGMDLVDGWPWETKWAGKAGAESSWISHIRVPFSRSFRMTTQVACGTPACAGFGIPADLARPDIGPSVAFASNFLIRGIEGNTAELGVSLGLGTLRIPPPPAGAAAAAVDWSKFRLHLQRTVSRPGASDWVSLANYSAAGSSVGAGAGAGVDGAVLMMTVHFDGIALKGPLSVEGCWWALDNPAAALRPGANSSDRRGAQLLGTGVEDLLGAAFGFTWWTKTFRNDHAGLTHIGGGPNAIPHAGSGNVEVPYKPRFTLYRYFDKDPLTFEDGRLELLWRNEVRGSKCGLLKAGQEAAVAPRLGSAGATGVTTGGADEEQLLGGGAGTVTGYVWFYTYANA